MAEYSRIEKAGGLADKAPVAPGARTHSKTMRLDILPSSDANPFAVRMRSEMEDGNARQNLSPELMWHLFQYSYDATIITDMQGRVLNGNLRAHEFLVGAGESLLGIGMTQIISGADDKLIDSLTSLLAAERFARINAWCQRSDGSYFPAEIAVHRMRVQQTSQLCFFIRDITWRKEAEERLKTVAIAMSTARAGIAVTDLEGTIVYANPAMCELGGRPESDALTGSPLHALMADGEVAARLLETVRAGQPWHGEVTLLRPEGGHIVTECDAVGNLDTEGELDGVVLSFVDMTDRQRAQQAERDIERNRVMMESIGSVCHHLGQPSTVLINTIEMLMRLKDDARQDREELLESCHAAAEQLCVTLHELNDLRLYRSEPYLANAPTDGSIVSL
jgi:PAS domain S-box-containing protein